MLGARHLISSRHREVRHFLNLCTTAPFFQLKFSRHRISANAALNFSATAPYYREKIRKLKNSATEPYISKMFAQNCFMYYVPISGHQSLVSCLKSPSQVSCLTSPLSRLLSHVSCLLSHVSCLLSHVLLDPVSCLTLSCLTLSCLTISCLTSACLTSAVSRLLSHVSCPTVSCLTSAVSRLLSHEPSNLLLSPKI